MRWLVDGYNVIRRDPDLRAREAESLGAGRAALLARLMPRARAGRDEFVVVFDGARVTGGARPGERLRVVFSRPPATADDELVRLARQGGAGVVLVTSDRRVQDAGRRAGATVVESEAFLASLAGASGARAATPGSGPAPPDAKDEDDDEPPRDKRGNPRRLSRRARAARRALRRLGGA